MAEEDAVQLNAEVPARVKELVDTIAHDYGTSRRQVVTIALETLGHTMRLLNDKIDADDPDDDVRWLLWKVSSIVPSSLVALKELQIGRTEEGPFVVIDGWALAQDPMESDWLMITNGTHRGRIRNGVIELAREPTVEEIAATN